MKIFRKFCTACTRVCTALPYWRRNNPPEDKLVNEEEDVVFDCQADGIPRPRISWFINGLPIDCKLASIYYCPR